MTNKIRVKLELFKLHEQLNKLTQVLDEGDYWMNLNVDQEGQIIEVDDLGFDCDDDYPTRLHFALICAECGRTRENSLDEPCINCV